MKNLEEKKLLLKMMRAFGQDDKELAESIRREEELTEKFLGIKRVEPEPVFEEIKQEPAILVEADPVPPVPAPAFVPPTSNTVLDVVNVLKTANANTSIYRDKELEGMRRTIAEMMQKISTMSWGGGGTGIVRVGDADDFDRNSYGAGRFLKWIGSYFTFEETYVTGNTTANVVSSNGINFVNTNSIVINVAPSLENTQTANIDFEWKNSDQGPIRSLRFDTAGPISNTPLPGTIAWNPAEDCLNIYEEDNSVLQVGLENYIRVRNLSGNTMNNGTLVQFAGVNGNFDPIAAPLLANTTYDPLFTIGVLTESIANGDVGRATTFGKVRNLNTTGPHGEVWQIGDLLWADPVHAGSLTNVKPTAPNVAISIAAVTRVDATEGEILVRPTITPRLFYGNFAKTSNQALTLAGTAYPVIFDKTNFSSGHVLNANGVITSQVTGLFKYDVNYNITSSNASRTFVYMWIRKNGVDQQNTALRFSIESNGGEAVPHGSFVLSMQSGDNVQMMIAATGTSISLFGLGASGIYPSAPSAVLTVSQINQ